MSCTETPGFWWGDLITLDNLFTINTKQQFVITKPAFFAYSRPYNEFISFNLLASVSKLSKLKELGILHFQFPNCVASTNISYTLDHYNNQIHRYHISFLENLNFIFFLQSKVSYWMHGLFSYITHLRWY